MKNNPFESFGPQQSRIFLALRYSLLICFTAFYLAGCSAGKKGLISITPQQYFYSAKEKLEVVDERNYGVQELDEIIRILENAEKDSKSGEIIDKSRMYLTLVNTIKARRQYATNQLKGQFLANRAEPFYFLDVKPVKETLRIAKKWLRACEAAFKTKSLAADLELVKAMFYTQKMLTQNGVERQATLSIAIKAYRRCLGMAPDYKSDFRLFGRILGPREVRLKMIECLGLGGEIADAYSLISEYKFSPAFPREDYPWMHFKGLILALMGQYTDAAELLAKFKIVNSQDFPTVDEALWVLEGVYDRLKEVTKDPKYGLDSRIVASLLKELKGPFSKEKYTTASHLFPSWLPGDIAFFKALISFVDGNFIEAKRALAPYKKGGLLSRSNRLTARVLEMECDLFSGEQITDEMIEDLLAISIEKTASPLLPEHIGYLLARYILENDKEFKAGRLEGEGQAFIKAITSKPWALSLRFERGKLSTSDDSATKTRGRIKARTKDEKIGEPPKREPSKLIAEIYSNRAEDWVVSATLNLVRLPQLELLGQGRVVGREEEGKEGGAGWVFASSDIDELRRRGKYLALIEFTNSDSEKSYQGIIFEP